LDLIEIKSCKGNRKSELETVVQLQWGQCDWQSFFKFTHSFFHLLQLNSEEIIIVCQRPSYSMPIIQVVGRITVYDKRTDQDLLNSKSYSQHFRISFCRHCKAKSNQPNKTVQSFSSRLRKQL